MYVTEEMGISAMMVRGGASWAVVASACNPSHVNGKCQVGETEHLALIQLVSSIALNIYI